jgi:hypothetical protein
MKQHISSKRISCGDMFAVVGKETKRNEVTSPGGVWRKLD